MKKYYLVSLLAIVLLAAGCNSTTQTNTVTESNQTNPDTESPKVQTYTLAEVTTGKNDNNCLVAVSDSVYNLSDWIAKHPGGPDKIRSICGTDATTAFTKQHGSSEKAQAALERYKIGQLAK